MAEYRRSFIKILIHTEQDRFSFVKRSGGCFELKLTQTESLALSCLGRGGEGGRVASM